MTKRLIVALALAGVFLLCLSNIQSHAAPKYEARMYGMTGLLGRAAGFSLGVDTAMSKAVKAYPTIKTYPRTHWQKRAVFETVKANYKRDKLPIILVGHSLGADAVSDVAGWLKADGIPVAAAFYYDPTPFVACVPTNVQAALGWHNIAPLQLGGGAIEKCPGFKGDLEDTPLYEAHINIDDDPKVHADTVRRIGEVITMIREMKGSSK